MHALKKVEVPLSERYTITCARECCGHIRQVFGTEKEARESAERMGWEFRMQKTDGMKDPYGERFWLKEQAYCPHCQLLTKEKP